MIQEIEDFLKKQKMSESEFGRKFMRDPRFVYDLRERKIVVNKTILRRMMKEYEQKSTTQD